MSHDTRGNKRKSADSSNVAVKKVKTAPSSEKPVPHKSALKKAKSDTSEAKKEVVAGKEVSKTRSSKRDASAPAVEPVVTPAIAKDEVELKSTQKEAGKPAKASKKATKPTKAAKVPVSVSEPEQTVAKPSKAGKKVAKPAKAAKAPEPAPEPEQDDVDEAEAEDQLTADRTAELLAGFSSSEDEDDDGSPEEEGLALSKIPNVPDVKADILSITNSSSKEKDSENTPGTIIISRLPHGFFEAQMRAYFVQFGAITHLRLARNKKTGKSKHFAFIEFASSNVADIVAKTMDKYLLFGHILQVKRVSDEAVGDGVEFWRGEGKKKIVPRNKLEGARLRRGMGNEAWEKRVERENAKRVAKAEKLAELGYEFEMPAVKVVDEVVKAVEAASEVVETLTGVDIMQDAPEKTSVLAEKTKKRTAGAAVTEAKAPKPKKSRKSV